MRRPRGAGAALLIGFLTPLAAALVALGAIGTALCLVSFGASLFDANLPSIGPGADWLDACLFGRREIIIPPVSRSPR